MNARRRELWQRLVDGALSSISERGYAETSVSHIANNAQVGRTQFYFVFQDKQDCFLALQSAVFDELCSRVELAVDGEDSWEDQMKTATETVLELFDDDPAMARIALVESALAGPTAQEQHRLAMSRLLSTIDCDPPARAASRGLPDSLGEMALGSACAVLNKALVAEGSPDFIQLAPEVHFALAMPFVGPETAATKTREKYPDLAWAGPRRNSDQPYS